MTLAEVNPPRGRGFEETLKPRVEAETFDLSEREPSPSPSKEACWLFSFSFFPWEEVTAECLAFSHGLFSPWEMF